MLTMLMFLTASAFGQEEVHSQPSNAALRGEWNEERGYPHLDGPLAIAGMAAFDAGGAALVGAMVVNASLTKQGVALQDPQGNFSSAAEHSAALDRYGHTRTTFVALAWTGGTLMVAGPLVMWANTELKFSAWKRRRIQAAPTVSLDGGTPNFGVYGRF